MVGPSGLLPPVQFPAGLGDGLPICRRASFGKVPPGIVAELQTIIEPVAPGALCHVIEIFREVLGRDPVDPESSHDLRVGAPLRPQLVPLFDVPRVVAGPEHTDLARNERPRRSQKRFAGAGEGRVEAGAIGGFRKNQHRVPGRPPSHHEGLVDGRDNAILADVIQDQPAEPASGPDGVNDLANRDKEIVSPAGGVLPVLLNDGIVG